MNKTKHWLRFCQYFFKRAQFVSGFVLISAIFCNCAGATNQRPTLSERQSEKVEEAGCKSHNSSTNEETTQRSHQHNNQRKYEMPGRMKGTPEKIITHTGYTVSFNRLHNNPNWVAWELTSIETKGEKLRAKDFLPDPMVQTNHQVTTEDYKGSGYDRGHMAPAADMKWSATAMKESFYMSNICPQDGGLNSGPWLTLEKACRRWAQQEGCVYIVCGPVYKNTKKRTIGKHHEITIPDGFFKVVLSMKEGKEKAIGFYYENRKGKQDMQHTAKSVDEIEAITGINFFVNVPDKLEDKIEATYNLKVWK